MGRIIALSEYKKNKRYLPNNLLRLRPMATGISRNGNIFIYNYLCEMNDNGTISDFILHCLIRIFKNERFELIDRNRIDEYTHIFKPDEVDAQKTESTLLAKANEGNERFEEYAQAFISYSTLNHVIRTLCQTENERNSLKEWHSYILCLIFNDIHQSQKK